jgi:hypothetical protein
MTHEELLANINDQEFAYDTLANALRAVVELHKLDQWGEECKHCDNGSYPCETIQAIGEQLK